MGNAYTIEMPRKMRTHPTNYVGRLRTYYQYEPDSRCEEHLRGREPRPPTSGPISTSQSGRPAKRPADAAERSPEDDRSNDRALWNCNYPLQDPQAYNSYSVHEPGHLATVPLHSSAPEHQDDLALEPDQVIPPPPHPLVDSGGVQRFLVERILNHRDVSGFRTNYLVRWHCY
uniref:Chromo domain-containing protein n=1 Tax=Peronospora matthiolae TaxID=2874970 RepID=A0AAV1U846_9STRA